MIIKIKRKVHKIDEPILHDGHKRPVTRREFLGAGLISGSAMVMGDSLLMGLMSNPALAATPAECGLDVRGAAKIPFIAFDLGGGANMAGSSVLIGGPGGQLDLLSTAGYNKLGLPGDMIPGAPEADGLRRRAEERLGHRQTLYGRPQEVRPALRRGGQRPRRGRPG